MAALNSHMNNSRYDHTSLRSHVGANLDDHALQTAAGKLAHAALVDAARRIDGHRCRRDRGGRINRLLDNDDRRFVTRVSGGGARAAGRGAAARATSRGAAAAAARGGAAAWIGVVGAAARIGIVSAAGAAGRGGAAAWIGVVGAASWIGIVGAARAARGSAAARIGIGGAASTARGRAAATTGVTGSRPGSLLADAGSRMWIQLGVLQLVVLQLFNNLLVLQLVARLEVFQLGLAHCLLANDRNIRGSNSAHNDRAGAHDAGRAHSSSAAHSPLG